MRILTVAGDAGGARALTPVIRRLLKSGAEVECCAYAAAIKIWASDSFETRPVFPVELTDYDKILLGTSVSAEKFELEIIRQARAVRVPTISVLDFWTNYRERFTAADGELVLPGAIAVMDERAREQMIALGFPAEILRVTGQPAFDELARYRREAATVEETDGERRAVVSVLYASQPLSQLYSREQLGFDEREVWSDVAAALSEILSRCNRECILYFKPHPREADGDSPPMIDSAFLKTVIMDAFADPRRAALDCDLVVGMNSILLLEACFLSRPVVSYQPNLLLPDPLPSNERGWSRAVY